MKGVFIRVYEDKNACNDSVHTIRLFYYFLNEENMHYDDETYITKCCQANLTPMKIFFDINDLTFFHKIDMKMFQYYYPNTLNYIGDRADCNRLITIRLVTYVLLLLVRTHQPDPHFISHSFTE